MILTTIVRSSLETNPSIPSVNPKLSRLSLNIPLPVKPTTSPLSNHILPNALFLSLFLSLCIESYMHARVPLQDTSVATPATTRAPLSFTWAICRRHHTRTLTRVRNTHGEGLESWATVVTFRKPGSISRHAIARLDSQPPSFHPLLLPSNLLLLLIHSPSFTLFHVCLFFPPPRSALAEG